MNKKNIQILIVYDDHNDNGQPTKTTVEQNKIVKKYYIIVISISYPDLCVMMTPD